ncbi:DMT family transporter [Duganella fentianensis]|uniref:DMT family transporter n=1 Tax=Duganella fentianensis TaxID=2692177 RepID=UPI0032B24176
MASSAHPSHLIERSAPWLFVFLWSTGYVAVKACVQYAPPFKLLLWRGGLSALVFLALALVCRVRFPSPRGMAQALLAGLLMQTLFLGGCFYAMSRGLPAAVTALITGLQPVLTALYVSTAQRQRLGGQAWLGIAVGFAGVYLVLAPGLQPGGLDGWAIMAACIALLAVTTGTLYQKQLPADGHVFASAFFQYVAVSVIMALVCLFDDSAPVQWQATFVFGLLWMVLGVSVSAVLLLIYLIRRGEATRVATYFYLVPVVTALLGWLLFGNVLTSTTLAGMALAVLGMLLVLRPAARAVQAAP